MKVARELLRLQTLAGEFPTLVLGTSQPNILERVERRVGVLLYSTLFVGPWKTARLSVTRFLQYFSIPVPLGNGFLWLRTEGGRHIPISYHDRAFPLGMVRDIFGSRAYLPMTRIGAEEVTTIVDCGGNIGVATAWFLENFPRARVHVFEPGSASFRCLQKNARAWGAEDRLVLNRNGVWSAPGCKTLFWHPRGSPSDSLFCKNGLRSESINMVRLEEYLKGHGIDRVDLLKLDVEGSELEALRGLGGAIANVRVIVGELHGRYLDPIEVLRYLKQKGFRIVRLELGHDQTMIFEAANEHWLGHLP